MCSKFCVQISFFFSYVDVSALFVEKTVCCTRLPFTLFLLCHVWLFETPWTEAQPGFLVLHHLLEFAWIHSIEFVIPSRHLILFHPLLLLPSIFPNIRVFSNESGNQSIEVSASESVLPMNIQDWFPLGWAGWISLQSKGLSKVFSNTIIQKHQFFCTQLSL